MEWVSRYDEVLLIPLDENKKTATIVFESNLKQAFLNAGQDDGH